MQPTKLDYITTSYCNMDIRSICTDCFAES